MGKRLQAKKKEQLLRAANKRKILCYCRRGIAFNSNRFLQCYYSFNCSCAQYHWAELPKSLHQQCFWCIYVGCTWTNSAYTGSWRYYIYRLIENSTKNTHINIDPVSMEVIVADRSAPVRESISPANEGISCSISENVRSITVPHTESAGATAGQISMEMITTELNSRTGNWSKIMVVCTTFTYIVLARLVTLQINCLSQMF